jgi:5,5'-dehydrodivanillate O-demethylase oxygenase subunit
MAKTKDQNERLTRVGPGTPMGDLLRRYWHPVAVTVEFDENPVRKIRLLGEDLTLFRSASGEYGLVGDECPHRCVSLEYGIPEARGLRCAYHGWLFDPSGACLEQPFDDRTNPDARFRDKIKIKAYPVRELGGLVFAYLGPQPASLLPRWDLLVRDDLVRTVDINPIPCNWLQCMDNSVDPLHFEFLHAGFGNYQMKRLGRPPGMTPARHLKIGFDVFEYGINKRRLLEGESEDATEWSIGHPLLFPALLAVGNDGNAGLHFRVPIDDTHTVQYTYSTTARPAGEPVKPIPVAYEILFDDKGKALGPIDTILKQDMVAWVAQGPISNRPNEHLSAGDTGIILYHKLLNENMDRVARGEDPMGTIRDAAANEPMIEIRRGHEAYKAFDVRHGLEPALWTNTKSDDKTLTAAV